MSLTLKLGSLVIRTLAKPIAVSFDLRLLLSSCSSNNCSPKNTIKRNAREHERFRNICVGMAQFLHRVDMRLRLGLLQDPAVIERQIEREMKEAEAKRKKSLPAGPTVKTEAETRDEEKAKKKERKEAEQHVKERQKPPRIRPLSESKAIETGANFISESFLFLVAAGAILFESWRSRRKESSRHDAVQDRLEELEQERDDMRTEINLLQSEITTLLEQKPIAPLKALPTPPPTPQPPDTKSTAAPSETPKEKKP